MRSMRSIARWVLPVLVGPSTAVTPRAGRPVVAGTWGGRREGHIFRLFLRRFGFGRDPHRCYYAFWKSAGSDLFDNATPVLICEPALTA